MFSTLRSLSPADEIPERVWIIRDSECTLASIEIVSAAVGEYFGNRISEILDNQAKIEQFCLVGFNGNGRSKAAKIMLPKCLSAKIIPRS